MASTPEITSEEVYPLVVEMASGNKTRAAQKVMKQIAALGVEALEPLVKASGHSNERVRVFAFMLLSNINDPRAVEPLIVGLSDDVELIPGSAIKGLRAISDARAIEPLKKFIREAETRPGDNPLAAAQTRVGPIMNSLNLANAIEALADLEAKDNQSA